MTRLKALQEQLLSQLATKLNAKGFKRKEQSFYKDIPGGKQIFHIAFIKHLRDFDLTADVAVRHDALEELVNEFNSTLSKKEKSQTASVGAELGNISMGKPLRWTVSSEADIPEVCESILAVFESVGLPYLQRFSSLAEVLSALSFDEQEAWLQSPIDHIRAKRAIGAAFLLDRKDTFAQLVKTKTQFLKEQNHLGLLEFISFAEKLLQRWVVLGERARREDRTKFKKAMAKVADVEPNEQDRL
jgi:hypothetical protein